MLYRNAPMVDRAVRITTSTTAVMVASEITRLNATYSSRSKNLASPVIWAIVSFTEVNTASPSRVYQTTAVATTIMMPIATDSRNDSFITDHGSIRATASRTLRAAPGVVVAVATEPVPTDAAPTEGVPDVGASRTAVGTPSSAVAVGPPVRVASATFCAVRLIRSPIDGALSPLSGAGTRIGLACVCGAVCDLGLVRIGRLDGVGGARLGLPGVVEPTDSDQAE